jgi:mono/diheme cytochrome c family protein
MFRKKMKLPPIFAMGILSFTSALSHQGEDHSKPPSHGSSHEAKPPPQASVKMKKISEAYLKNVKPIFEKKCFDCHGSTTQYPWYARLPGPKQLIEYDVGEAKKHLDLSPGYPFKSHSTPIKDLQAIRESIKKGEMPPFRYRIMHWGSKLTDEEYEKVRQWTDDGEKLLQSQE